MIKLTDEQKLLIEYKGNTILKAGPGSGKTLSITALINKEMEKWKREFRGIAIISFCNSSVEELKSRINNIYYPHYIGTIDGFVEKYILSILSKFIFSK